MIGAKCSILVVWLAGTLRAQPCDPMELAKLTATDGQDGDLFGGAVAIEGSTALIGAFRHDANGRLSGAVYAFHPGDNGGWAQADEFAPADGSAWDTFGRSIDISGQLAIVGAPGDDLAGTDRGSAYIFEVDDVGEWTQVAKVVAADGADLDAFGIGVAISGETAVVASEAHMSGSGAVYVFERTEQDEWVQSQKLTASDGAENDTFGSSVDVSGDTIAVGAQGHDANGNQSGAAYMFERGQNGAWSEAAKLLAADGGESDSFGGSIAIDAETVLVGASLDDLPGFATGSAYLFTRDDRGVWSEAAKLAADDGAAGDRFGQSVAIHGNTALVGASNHDGLGDASGAAYVFARGPSGEWSQEAAILASDGAGAAYFGTACAMAGDTFLIGATGAARGAGAAYAFGCQTDTDGDGLLDTWETEGLDVNADGVIDLDLPAMGADPMHKDLFVEVDVMDGVPLDPDAIAAVVDAFAFSPVDNPDGFLGIDLHVDLATADTIPHEATWDDGFVAFGAIKSVYLGTDGERLSDNWQHIRDARTKVFRYCTVVDAFESGALGWGENPGNDFMVAFGGSASNDRHLQSSTFMHELGHTLGLGHGGAYEMGDELVPDEVNYKPNYVSVMNYAFSLYEYANGGKLFIDFSREPLLPLIEDNLDESIGITSSWYFDVLVFHAWREPGEQPEIDWVQLDVDSYDWNHDGEQEAGVIVDLNWLGEGYPDGEDPSPGQTMNGYNDWEVIRLPMGDAAGFEDGQHIPPPYEELTEAGLTFLRENVPPAPTCPADCDASGELNVLDFVCFQGLFQAGDEAADCNGDGTLDVLDFVCFQGQFVAGCP